MTDAMKRVIEWCKEGHDSSCSLSEHHEHCGCPECECDCGREQVSILLDEHSKLTANLKSARQSLWNAAVDICDGDDCNASPTRCRKCSEGEVEYRISIGTRALMSELVEARLELAALRKRDDE